MKPKKGKKGFEGYKKVASSKSLNTLAAKKRIVGREHPKAEYKFTKDAEGNTNMYAKYKKGGKIKYGYGGKLKKYLKGGQVKLDANKDGKITGADFKMLRKK